MTLFKLVFASTFLFIYPAFAQSGKMERGKYPVEEVARCQECHTPKLPDGQFDKSKWLKGAALNVQPIEAIADWHKTSPDLTASSRLWQRWGDAGFVKFLTTSLAPNGRPAGAPMPMYKVTQEDAEAIVEYLKSLK